MSISHVCLLWIVSGNAKILGAKFKSNSRKPSSENPLIFESVTEVSLPIINGSNGSREKFSFNLILCRFFSFLTFYNFFIFFSFLGFV